MKQYVLNAVWFALATVFSGCASLGHSFNSKVAQQLDFGSVQTSNYRSVLGENPTATEQRSTPGGKFEIVRYTNAFGALGTASARVLLLEFKEDKLNAFMYLSSFAEDQTHTPADNVNQISSHVSTKTDVLNILGKPNGKAHCPSNLEDFKDKCEKCVEVWKWNSISSHSTLGSAYGGQKLSTKSVSIGFDKDGVVSEINTASVNTK
jgi:hypothetical protein